MARGKPGREQLDLVSDILTALTDPADCICGGIDARNYGELCGLPEARALYAEILGCRPTGDLCRRQRLAGAHVRTHLQGLDLRPQGFGAPLVQRGEGPLPLPRPGYDRHFRVTETFGIELVTVP